MIRIYIYTLLLLFSSIIQAQEYTKVSFDDNKQLYIDEIKGLVNKDVKELTKKAKKGDAYAALLVGDIYRRGFTENGKTDYKKAIRFYEKAMELQEPRSFNRMAHMYRKGLGVKENFNEYLRFNKEAAALSYAHANYELGNVYRSGLNTKIDLNLAKEFYYDAAEKSHKKSMVSLGEIFEDENNAKLGFKPNLEEALMWFDKSDKNKADKLRLKVSSIFDLIEYTQTSPSYFPITSDANYKTTNGLETLLYELEEDGRKILDDNRISLYRKELIGEYVTNTSANSTDVINLINLEAYIHSTSIKDELPTNFYASLYDKILKDIDITSTNITSKYAKILEADNQRGSQYLSDFEKKAKKYYVKDVERLVTYQDRLISEKWLSPITAENLLWTEEEYLKLTDFDEFEDVTIYLNGLESRLAKVDEFVNIDFQDIVANSFNEKLNKNYEHYLKFWRDVFDSMENDTQLGYFILLPIDRTDFAEKMISMYDAAEVKEIKAKFKEGGIALNAESLVDAVREGYPEIVTKLFRAGVSPDSYYEGLPTYFHTLIFNQPKSFSAFIEYGVNINAQTKDDNNLRASSLMMAISLENNDWAIDSLISNGINVKLKDTDNYNALTYAIQNGNIEIVRKILAAGESVNVKVDANNVSPLMVAVDKENSEMVKFLLSQGADINQTSDTGKTALHYAAGANKGTYVASILMENGASLYKPDGGYLPIHTAAKEGNNDLISYFLMKGGKTLIDNADNEAEITPLLAAILGNHTSTIDLLIVNGADKNKLTNGQSCLDYAESIDDIKTETVVHLRNMGFKNAPKQQESYSSSSDSYSSGSSYSSYNSAKYDEPKCETFASLYIDVRGQLEGDMNFEVTPPDGIYFKGGGGFIFSNTKSDKGTVSGDCIKGTYSFIYSYTNSGKRKTFTGSFYLDGEKNSYDIYISNGWGGPNIDVY